MIKQQRSTAPIELVVGKLHLLKFGFRAFARFVANAFYFYGYYYFTRRRQPLLGSPG